MSDILKPEPAPIDAVVPDVDLETPVPAESRRNSKSDWGKVFTFEVGEVKIYRTIRGKDSAGMDDTERMLYAVGEAAKVDFPDEKPGPDEKKVPVDAKENYLTYIVSLLTKSNGGKKDFSNDQIEKKLAEIAASDREMIALETKPTEAEAGDDETDVKEEFKYRLNYLSLEILIDGAVKATRPNVPKQTSANPEVETPVTQEATQIEAVEGEPIPAKTTHAQWRASKPDISEPKPPGYKGPHPAIVQEIEETIEVCKILATELGNQSLLDSIDRLDIIRNKTRTKEADETLKKWQADLARLRAHRLIAHRNATKPSQKD